jgi:aspartyl/asparaginyl beta-hydroxylase (cupin superfamily)
MEGKVVMWRKQQLVKGLNKVSLLVSELPKGIYFIKVDTGSRSATEKLVVQ